MKKYFNFSVEDIDKGQDVENFYYNITQQLYGKVISEEDKYTRKIIEEYCEENGIIPIIISKEKLDLVLKLGINELRKREMINYYDKNEY